MTGWMAVDAHIALLGDSIFDNAAYTAGEPDVVSHLRGRLPRDWRATLLAEDGSTVAGVSLQLQRLTPGITHLAVSAGGNDALLNSDVLAGRASTVAAALRAIGERAARFERSYREMIRGVMAFRLPTIVCTIYNGNFDDEWGEAARLGLALFNDPILRVAFEHGLDVIDLRLVCSEPEDYANPIEPSGRGGRKIAAALAAAAGIDAGAPHSRVFA